MNFARRVVRNSANTVRSVVECCSKIGGRCAFARKCGRTIANIVRDSIRNIAHLVRNRVRNIVNIVRGCAEFGTIIGCISAPARSRVRNNGNGVRNFPINARRFVRNIGNRVRNFSNIVRRIVDFAYDGSVRVYLRGRCPRRFARNRRKNVRG